eukprot:GHVT01058739.1.p1 GENE.GHVT01058739.1~~GHVT01058739.1.p1  ORF type:complete len:174 (+),score=51.52 GHVT01058739.1:117-638(+)
MASGLLGALSSSSSSAPSSGASASINTLFEDRFLVRSIDNSKFESVSRLRGKSTGFEAELTLDVNSELFDVKEQDSIYVALATSLGLGGASARKEESGGPWERDDALAAALDQFEYVMYGRIFKLEEQSSERRTLYASFGGLLMALTADKQVVGDLDLDMRVYILLKQGGEVY